jgi:hypothetical protein
MRQISHTTLSSLLRGSPLTVFLYPPNFLRLNGMSPLSEESPGYARETKGPTVLAVCSTLTVVATLFVAGRLYVRTKILARVGLDDWLILLSMVSVFEKESSRTRLICDPDMRLRDAWLDHSSREVW